MYREIARDDSVERIREEAERRLHELAPVLEEADRLRTVLAVLTDGGPAAGDLPATRPGGGDADGEIPYPDGEVPARKERIMAIVAENPGITAATIARRTGMKRGTVASIISRLKRTGELLPEGKGARLPSGKVSPTAGTTR